MGEPDVRDVQARADDPEPPAPVCRGQGRGYRDRDQQLQPGRFLLARMHRTDHDLVDSRGNELHPRGHDHSPGGR